MLFAEDPSDKPYPKPPSLTAALSTSELARGYESWKSCTGVVRSVSAAAGELYDRLAGLLRLESTAVAAEGEGSGRGGGGGGGGSLERIRQQQAKASIAGILGNVGEATTLMAEVWKERVVLGDRVGQCDYVV